MPLITATVTDSHGAKRQAKMSREGTFVIMDDETFAVRQGCYDLGNGSLYLKKMRGTETLTVASSGVTAQYDVFCRQRVQLPDTCIESAEHVLKCMHRNAHDSDVIPNKKGARVIMSIGTVAAADVDDNDMNDVALALFKDGKLQAHTASRESFGPGDGMALLWSKTEQQRNLEKEERWQVHAVAVLMRSTVNTDPLLVTSETFARDTDSNHKVAMSSNWKLNYFDSADDFHTAYEAVMPRADYTLWKLTSAER